MNNTAATCRVAVITGVPAPYREPVLEELARQSELSVRVFYAAKGHSDVGWSQQGTRAFQYDRAYPKNITPTRFQRLPLIGYANLELSSMLAEFEPNYMIVYGYNQIFHWLAFRHAFHKRVPFALRTDSNVHLDRSRKLRSHARRGLLRMLARHADAFLTVGSANQMYWESYGAKPEQLFASPYAIDNKKVASIARERPVRDDARLRIIYVGRLIPRKAVDVLLTAFNEVCESLNLSLSIVGDGPERSRLQNIQSSAAQARTAWLGKLPNEDAFRAMADADLFMLPSRYEPWGLVVNEAMAAGLPVVAHKHCGAAIDLIDHGQTGWILSDIDPSKLIAILREAAADRDRLAQMGHDAQQRIQNWSIERTVQGFLAAIRTRHATPIPQREEAQHVQR